MSSLKRLVLLLGPLLVAHATGCSFIFVDGPKPGTAAPCTDSFVFPGVDLGLATYEGLRIAYVATRSDAPGVLISKRADIAIASGSLALFAASAIVGAVNVSACRASIARAAEDGTGDAREQAERWQRQRQREQQQRAVQAPSQSPPVAAPN